jgi:hippurate hydrolase
MLLGAAKYLAETRNFDGTAVVIFQPAEEGGGGGRVMVEDGMMERWNIQEVYGMHNWPGKPTGSFMIRPGAFFAATDQFEITVTGKGGHAAKPHQSLDPIVTAAQMVMAFQTIAARNADPVDQIVVSVTSVESSSKAFNVIPGQVTMKGTIRTMSKEMRKLGEARLKALARLTAEAFGAVADVRWIAGYPSMVNHEENTRLAAEVAESVAGSCDEAPLVMGGEDFAYMLERRPGAYILIGNGDTAQVHNAEYNFNDEAIPAGCSWLAGMVERRMPMG